MTTINQIKSIAYAFYELENELLLRVINLSPHTNKIMDLLRNSSYEYEVRQNPMSAQTHFISIKINKNNAKIQD